MSSQPAAAQPAAEETSPEERAHARDPVRRPRRRAGPVESLVTYPLLFLIGALLGAIGAFLVPLRVGTTVVPVSLAVAAVGNVAVGVFGARRTRPLVGAAVPLVGWLVTVMWLSMQRPEGDLVLAQGSLGLPFLLVGAVAGAVAMGMAPSYPRASRPSRTRSGNGDP